MTAIEQPQAVQSDPASTATQIDWAHIIKQWKSSGMSQSAYCKANNINYNQFIYQNAKQVRAKVGSTLLPVHVIQSDNINTGQHNFMLQYPSGLKLHIPINTHPEAIKALLNCLGE
jgi:hypothetical protein